MRNVSIGVIVLLCLALLYVLSYAPFYRLAYGSDHHPTVPAVGGAWDWVNDDTYRPVCWMIDYTVLREPLLLWAEVWDVDDNLTRASASRRFGIDAHSLDSLPDF